METKDKDNSDDEATSKTLTNRTAIYTINTPESDEDEEEEIDEQDDYDDSDNNESMNFPAISPISSNTSSGFISCGSSSSSKPTTPTPSTDKNCDDEDDDEGAISDNNNSTYNKASDEIIIISDNENGDLAINKSVDSERDSKKFLSSLPSTSSSSSASSSSSTSNKGVRIRTKHRNLSTSSDHYHPSSASSSSSSSTMRYRQSKKHISLDDEIVIYESDSSLVDSRRRISNQTMFNRVSSQNQGLSANAVISRHKSEEHPSTSTAIATTTQPSNQIVSILKRKDSSGKDSPSLSLVTFSPNVKDIEPTRSMHRQGILKKRSSLDESSRHRYRSHSPSSASSESEKGCLIKNNRRRNSCEEIHHGILKQKSYESSTGYSSSASGVNTPNSGVQGILKKPSLTPSSDHSSDHTTKHVSISEAVILAAAELCKDMIIDDSHDIPYIKPILKMDNEHQHNQEIKPKPILKKNYSSENEENIRSILKSRKSSREEPDSDFGHF